MISLLIYIVSDYDIFEVVKDISSSRVKSYSIWERMLVQLVFTLDVFCFTVMFASFFIYAIRSFV